MRRSLAMFAGGVSWQEGRDDAGGDRLMRGSRITSDVEEEELSGGGASAAADGRLWCLLCCAMLVCGRGRCPRLCSF